MYKYDIQSNLFRSIFYLKVGTNITSTAKQVLGNCERMVLANLIGNRMSIFIFMNLVVNLYILLNCCTMLLNFLLIFAVKLCLILLVVNLYCTGVL